MACNKACAALAVPDAPAPAASRPGREWVKKSLQAPVQCAPTAMKTGVINDAQSGHLPKVARTACMLRPLPAGTAPPLCRARQNGGSAERHRGQGCAARQATGGPRAWNSAMWGVLVRPPACTAGGSGASAAGSASGAPCNASPSASWSSNRQSTGAWWASR